MYIRCNKCFEIYDESFNQCPSCENLDLDSFKKGELKYDYLDRLFFSIYDKVKIPFKIFFRYRYCEFCGRKSFHNSYFCPKCKNGFSAVYDKSKRSSDYPAQGLLSKVTRELIKSNTGFIDREVIGQKYLKHNFDIEKWNINGQLKTGKTINKYLNMLIYSSSLFVLFGLYSSSNNYKFESLWFFIALILGNIVAIPISKRIFSEYIYIYKTYISIYQMNNRYHSEVYGVNPNDIKSIELVFDSVLMLENIIFRAKDSSDVKNLAYNISVLDYADRNSIYEYLILYTYKNEIDLYITKKEISNSEAIIIENSRSEDTSTLYSLDSHNKNLESLDKLSENKIIYKKNDDSSEVLFVRIDRKLKDSSLSEMEFFSHMDYLKDISLKEYFMGGGFEDEGGGMIIFSAKDRAEADKIAKGDPLISSGVYTYELKEWNVLLKSSNYKI